MKTRATTITEILLAFAASVAANVGGARLVALTGSIVLTLLIPPVLMLAAVAAVALAFGDATKENFGLYAPSPRHLIPSGVTGVGGYYLISAVTLVMGVIFPSLTNATDSALYDVALSRMSPAAVIITVVVVPAICEELIFRGFIFRRLTSVIKPLPAMIISGVIFGVAHFDLYKLLPVTVMGVVLAYVAYKTGSFVMTAILHMLNNAVSVVALFRNSSAAEEGYTIIISNNMALFYAAAYTALGAGILYIGLKLFKTVTLKGWKSKLIIIGCALTFFGCNFGAVMSEAQIPFAAAGLYSLPEDSVYEQSFTVGESRLSHFSFSVAGGRGVHSIITLTDADGDEVFRAEGDDQSINDIRVIKAGDYTFRCEASPAVSNSDQTTTYIMSCKITTYYQVQEEEASNRQLAEEEDSNNQLQTEEDKNAG